MTATIANAANTQPNFVVFLVDDLGFMDIAANNPNCFYETPNIDAKFLSQKDGLTPWKP